jgi:hypothetical protein
MSTRKLHKVHSRPRCDFDRTVDALETAHLILSFYTPLRTDKRLLAWMWPRIVLHLFDTHMTQCQGTCWVIPTGYGLQRCSLCATYGSIECHTPSPTSSAFSWFNYMIVRRRPSPPSSPEPEPKRSRRHLSPVLSYPVSPRYSE